MEENNNSLIPVNHSLAKIERQIAIGEKLLRLGGNKLQREQIKNLLIRISQINKKFFFNLISANYPFNEEMLMELVSALV